MFSRWNRIVVALSFTLVCGPLAAQWVQPGGNGTPIYFTNNVGIGSSAVPASLLSLSGANGVNAITLTSPGAQDFRFQTIPGIVNWGALTLNGNFNGTGWVLDDTAQNGWFFKLDGRGSQGTASVFNGLWLYRVPPGAGNHTDEYATFGVTNGYAFFKDKVGINTPGVPDSALQVVGSAHITVDLTVDGNIAAKYQDVAEWVPATGKLAPGTVVVLNRERENEVMASSHAYDTGVAGVVSAQPGLILGEPSSEKAKIATTGRVKVRVDATKHAIHIGDLLVTGEKPGTAMLSEPIDLPGVKIHRPGTLIGKALEPLSSGEGQILVLLSLQ